MYKTFIVPVSVCLYRPESKTADFRLKTYFLLQFTSVHSPFTKVYLKESCSC
jgi:hypothetical protein